MDDTFILTRNHETATEILQQFNRKHQDLHFEIETPQNNSIFLDLMITSTPNGLSINFYRKPARTDIFINRKTALPMTQIKSIVVNEASRIMKRCDKEDNKEREINKRTVSHKQMSDRYWSTTQ